MAKICFINIKGRKVYPVTRAEAVIVKDGLDEDGKPFTLKKKIDQIDKDIEDLKNSDNIDRVEEETIESIFKKENV